jgi:ubiquinone biosynthesis protein
VRSWIEENLGVKAKIEDASRSVTELAKLATHLPRTLAEAELAVQRISKMAEEGVELSDRSIGALDEMRRRSDRWFVLAVIALALLAVWIL